MTPDDKIAKFKAGTLRTASGEVVTSEKQAMVIAMSEAGRSQDSSWITVHPNGQGTKGVPVRISENGTIEAGMGGKHNGKKLSELKQGSNNMKNTSEKLDKIQNSGNAFAKMAVMAHQSKINAFKQSKEKYDKLSSSSIHNKNRTYLNQAKWDMQEKLANIERSETDIVERAKQVGIDITQEELRRHYVDKKLSELKEPAKPSIQERLKSAKKNLTATKKAVGESKKALEHHEYLMNTRQINLNEYFTKRDDLEKEHRKATRAYENAQIEHGKVHNESLGYSK